MATYSLRKHRTAAITAMAIAVIVGGGGAGLATAASHSQWSIDELQVDATLQGDRLSVVETYDRDFGLKSGRGIIREVELGVVDRPERVEIENIRAATATANDTLTVYEIGGMRRLRVGHSDHTFTGLHRYRLSYDLVGVPDPRSDGQFTFIAMDGWEEPIRDVTVRVAADFEPTGARCTLSSGGSFRDCQVAVDDGIVTATASNLAAGDGIAVQAEPGEPRAPATLEPPPLEADKNGGNPIGAIVVVGLAAALAGVAGAVLGGWWVRRAGADFTASVANPAEAAYAALTDGGQAISDTEAADHVTVQFTPPEGLTPAEGAVLERERVDDAAKTAWLAQAVIDGWIELTGDLTEPTMTHTQRADSDPAHMPAPLGLAFNGRREIELGKYDSNFAAGWRVIDGELEAWKRASGLWDEPRRKRNVLKAWVLLTLGALVAMIIGMILVLGLGRSPGVAALAAAGAGLLFGCGVRAVLGIPTLTVRNPAGFGLWLRTEGFRRFLAESEGQHARWAADRGLLREFSAWAVALRELDRWNRAAAAAGIPPSDPALMTTTAFVGLDTAARSTSVQPSSSGDSSGGSSFSGGGDFSGGVGGGGGRGW